MSQAGDAAPVSRREAIARERAAPRSPRGSGHGVPGRSGRGVPPTTSSAPGPPRAARPRSRRSLGSRILGAGVLALVAVVAVGLSMPANAFYRPGVGSAADAAALTALAPRGDQRLAVDGSAQIPTTTSDYEATSWAQVLAQRYGRAGGSVGGASSGAVRWPFPYPVAILSPYGPRPQPAGCPTCAPFHSGVDLAGGDGAPIFSIADGVVTERTGGSWTYGVYAIIVSRVDGHEIRAIYEHMQEGSSPLVVGQQVKAGDFIGLVGMTGEATAPHLHLEIDVDGARTDPIPWLKHYAG